MNRIRIQYALITHRELTEVKRRFAALEIQLAQRLAVLDMEERSEYSNRTGAIADDPLDNR